MAEVDEPGIVHRSVVEIDQDRNPVEEKHECPVVEAVYLVWCRFKSDGAQTVVMAFAKRVDAERHAERSLREEWADEWGPGLSPAEMLGISDVWVEELRVR